MLRNREMSDCGGDGGGCDSGGGGDGGGCDSGGGDTGGWDGGDYCNDSTTIVKCMAKLT